MKKRILAITLLLLLTSTIKAWAPAIGGGGIGAPISLTNVPQVSGKTVTFNNVYFGNWPLIIKSDGGTSNTPLEDYVIKYNAVTKSFGFEADAGAGAAYDTIQDEGGALAQRTTINFTGAGVSAADAGGITVVTIAGGGSGGGENIDTTLSLGNVTQRTLNIGRIYHSIEITGPTVSANHITASTIYADASIGCGGTVTGSIVSGGTVRWSGGNLPSGVPATDNLIIKWDTASGTWSYEADTGGASEINIELSPQSAKLPPSNFAAIDAGEYQWRLLFDAGNTQETAIFQTVIDDDYGAGTLYCDIFYTMTSATANEVEWEVAIRAISDGDAETIGGYGEFITGGNGGFDTTNSVVVTVPATAGYMDVATITLTNNDSLAAGDLIIIKISTDADDAVNDDAVGDRELLKAIIRE